MRAGLGTSTAVTVGVADIARTVIDTRLELLVSFVDEMVGNLLRCEQSARPAIGGFAASGDVVGTNLVAEAARRATEDKDAVERRRRASGWTRRGTPPRGGWRARWPPARQRCGPGAGSARARTAR